MTGLAWYGLRAEFMRLVVAVLRLLGVVPLVCGSVMCCFVMSDLQCCCMYSLHCPVDGLYLFDEVW